MKKSRFCGTVLGGHKNLAVEVPFDPQQQWDIEPAKLRKGRNGHRVQITIDGVTFESSIVPRSRRFWLELGPEASVREGDEIAVVVEPLSAPKERVGKVPVREYERVRQLCLSLPDVEEKLSHGAPAFFARKRLFVMFAVNHHGDGRHALWCNAPEGAQEILVASDPEHFFVPPYVGVGGWIGVRLDRRLVSGMVSSVVKDAYAASVRAAAKKRTPGKRARS
ncbi:MAG: MmcQ/YjbR family DNA-binding protein [Acidobacteriota bacterium]